MAAPPFAKIPILDKRDIAAKVAGTALAAKAHGDTPIRYTIPR